MSDCRNIGFKYCPFEKCKIVNFECVPRYKTDTNARQEKLDDTQREEPNVVVSDPIEELDNIQGEEPNVLVSYQKTDNAETFSPMPVSPMPVSPMPDSPMSVSSMPEEVLPKKPIIDISKIQAAYPSLDKKIIELVSSLNIPLDDDFKIQYYLQLTEQEKKKEFLEGQYKLFINFSSMFKKQLSRIFNRDVSRDIDLLILNGVLNNETFILANTVKQFQIVSHFLKRHNYNLYTHYTEIPEYLLKSICNLCGAALINRDGMTDNNSEGYIVSADNNEHLFHFKCLSNWVNDFSYCNVCNISIDKELLSKMSQSDKQLSVRGSNFLTGFIGGNRSKKNTKRRKYKSRK